MKTFKLNKKYGKPLVTVVAFSLLIGFSSLATVSANAAGNGVASAHSPQAAQAAQDAYSAINDEASAIQPSVDLLNGVIPKYQAVALAYSGLSGYASIDDAIAAGKAAQNNVGSQGIDVSASNDRMLQKTIDSSNAALGVARGKKEMARVTYESLTSDANDNDAVQQAIITTQIKFNNKLVAYSQAINSVNQNVNTAWQNLLDKYNYLVPLGASLTAAQNAFKDSVDTGNSNAEALKANWDALRVQYQVGLYAYTVSWANYQSSFYNYYSNFYTQSVALDSTWSDYYNTASQASLVANDNARDGLWTAYVNRNK